MMLTKLSYQSALLRNLNLVYFNKFTTVSFNNKLSIGRITHLNNIQFQVLNLLVELNKLKARGIRGRKRFGFLLKLLQTSVGHERISHSFLQQLFSFKNIHFLNWLSNSQLLKLYVIPFLEKCIISSPPEFISGYSLPLIQLNIKSDVFQARLAVAATDYGAHFPTNQILHSIRYLHGHRLNNLEPVIILANLITDIDQIIMNDDLQFSIGNLVQWLSDLGIRHDPLLQGLEQYMLKPIKATPYDNHNIVAFGREYVRRLLVEMGKAELPGDVIVSFRQYWPQDPKTTFNNISFKKIGNSYFWYRGRFKHCTLAIGMDKISSFDLCKIVVYGEFDSNDIYEAIIYDYTTKKSRKSYTRNYSSVPGELYGKFLLKLARNIKIPPEIANSLIDIALLKFSKTKSLANDYIIEASFHMGISTWHKWFNMKNLEVANLSLRSISYLSLMDQWHLPTSSLNLCNKLNIKSKYSQFFFSQNLPFVSTFIPTTGTSTAGKGSNLVPSPKAISNVPVYDRSTLHNYKRDKSKWSGLPLGDSTSQPVNYNILHELPNLPPDVKANNSVHFDNISGKSTNLKKTEILRASGIAILAVISQILLNKQTNVSTDLLNTITSIGKFRRYMMTPYSKIDQTYTLWTSAQENNYKRRLQGQLVKLGSTESVDPRFTVIPNSATLNSIDNKADKFDRSKANKFMDKPAGIQKRLEYFEEYLHRLSQHGMLLFESCSGEAFKSSSLENNIYQTLLALSSRENIRKQVLATTFTIDFVMSPPANANYSR